MIFKSIRDLTRDVLRLVPFCMEKNIGCIAGVPRSGLLPATILAGHMHLPLFLNGAIIGGNRIKAQGRDRAYPAGVLVLDDTIATAKSMVDLSGSIKELLPKHRMYRAAVYLDQKAEKHVDVFCESTEGWPRLFEWNFLNCSWTDQMMFDYDGVFCEDPPPERDEIGYVRYIQNAVPRYLPAWPVGWICTNRLQTRIKMSLEWLARHEIHFKYQMYMQPHDNTIARAAGIPNAHFKAAHYKAQRDRGCILFVESSQSIAEEIFTKINQPVLCTDTMQLYGSQ
jgi:hypothetical protein